MIPSAFSPRIFFGLVLIITLTSCGPAAAPEATEMPVEEVQPTQDAQGEVVPPPAIVPPTSFPTAQPAIPERRRVTLEYPPQIRAGDSNLVILTLEVDDLGNLTPTAQFGGDVVQGEVVEIPNLYETHHVIAEAQFDITGVQVSPPELISQPLAQGQSITFHWSILPEGVGIYRGTIWLYLRFVDKVSGEESQKTVSAQIVEIEAVNFLGLSGSFARTFGIVGSIVGTVLGIPFLEDIVRFVFGRRKKK